MRTHTPRTRKAITTMTAATTARRMKGTQANTDIALAVGHAAWWLPVVALTRNDKKQKLSFAEALKDFLAHVSFHCYGKLVEPGRRFLERFFWLVFHVAALCILIIFLWNTRTDEEQLMTTTIYDPLYPIQFVPFPAVTICSSNRISNESAWRYAQELSAKDPEKRGAKFFYGEVLMLSYNYFVQDDIVEYDRALEFQTFLDIFDTEDHELFYNTRRHMKLLTPPCESILLSCRLGGKQINCSAEFRETLTARGYCCTFNDDGKYGTKRSFKMRLFGKDNGLTVVLNNSAKDALYAMSLSEGFVTIIHAPGDYADIASGSVEERFSVMGYEAYMRITARMFRTVNEARYLRPATRNCLFEDEMPRYFGRGYTFNKCITRCRIHSILVLCQCLMFMSPTMYLDVATDTVFCTLKHKECLRRYDYKWRNVITHRKQVRGLEREMEDALYCPECLPSCSETRYRMTLVGLPLRLDSMRTLFANMNDSNTNVTIVHVFFDQTHIYYFRRILTESWFEVFSTIGSICGIMTGFSLVGICEMLYFLVKQFIGALQDDILLDRKRKHKRQHPEPLLILP